MKDPFVSAPYKECPQCKKKSLGVLSIGHTYYSLRCAECGYPRGTAKSCRYELPKIKKRIIYLDQFMISNMVKSLTPEFSKELDPFYMEAFKKLDRLSKLQLIICPDSNFHQDESELSKHPKELKRVYELLSHGVSFKSHWEIMRFQIMEHFENWCDEKVESETSLTIKDVAFGDPYGWQDKIQISIEYIKNIQHEEALRNGKNEVHLELMPVLQRWSNEKGKDINYFFYNELSAWDDNFSNAYDEWKKNVEALMRGDDFIDPLKAYPSPFALVSQCIQEGLIKKGKKGKELLNSYREFLSAESMKNVPYVRIYSITLAKLALKISQGLKVENVKPSFMSDALMIATILPFCDAVFTEKQLSNFFREKPLNQILQNMPKIYSLNEKNEFLEYLDDVERTAPKSHMELVERVYGKDWGEPFVDVFKKT